MNCFLFRKVSGYILILLVSLFTAVLLGALDYYGSMLRMHVSAESILRMEYAMLEKLLSGYDMDPSMLVKFDYQEHKKEILRWLDKVGIDYQAIPEKLGNKKDIELLLIVEKKYQSDVSLKINYFARIRKILDVAEIFWITGTAALAGFFIIKYFMVRRRDGRRPG